MLPTLQASYTFQKYRKHCHTFLKCMKHVSYIVSSCSKRCRNIFGILIFFFPECVGKFPILFIFFQNVCYKVEIFGRHLKFFLGNEPALHRCQNREHLASSFCFLFLLEHVYDFGTDSGRHNNYNSNNYNFI